MTVDSLLANTPSTRPLIKINLGCGGNWQVDGWFGLDQRSTSFVWQVGAESFLEVDLKRGLPFPDNSVDVVFTSHTLEHFSYAEGLVLLFEIYRVLRPGAPLCVVVPDMDIYIQRYVDRDEEFLNTATIIGGTPKNNLADNFLMNFYSDPKFNNTCHKYGYNGENLRASLQLVGFRDVEKVPFHAFSYWPEINQTEFRSPIPNIEQFSLCVQARKGDHDPAFRERPELKEAQTYARFRESELHLQQSLNAALMQVEQLHHRNSSLAQAEQAVAAHLEVVTAESKARIEAVQLECHRLQEALQSTKVEASSAIELREKLEALTASASRQEDDAKTRIASISYELAEARSSLKDRRRDTDSLESRLALSAHSLNALEGSLSWRVTRPLRSIASSQPGVYRQLRRMMKLLYWTATLKLPRELTRVVRTRRAPAPHAVGESQVLHTPPPSNPMRRLLAAAAAVPSNPALAETTRYTPTISIIVPTYNTPARYLKEVLQSIKNQTYSAWELCVVDDGSTAPEVAEILRSAAIDDQRVRVELCGSNCGIAVATQIGLGMARGEYVAFVDHDDVLAPGALSAVVEMLRGDPQLDMVYSDHAMMTEDGEVVSVALKPDWSPEFVLSTNYVVHFKVLRRSLVERLGGFEGTIDFSQDTGLMLKLLSAKARVARCPQILYFWRMHSGSVATGTSAKPRIGFTGCATVGDYLAREGINAEAVWPEFFRRSGIGAYKLKFPRVDLSQVSLVVPIWRGDQPNIDALASVVESLGAQLKLNLVGIGWDVNHLIDHPLIALHSVEDQVGLDNLIAGLGGKYVVFVSSGARIVSSSWLEELIGYLDLSDEIGAVGGKVLDTNLNVLDGARIASPSLPVVGSGVSDNSDGYWYTQRLASNVDLLSSRLLATTQSAYRRVGGVPLFSFGPDAGVAYSQKLRNEGYRLVFNAWSKVVETGTYLDNPNLYEKLRSELGTVPIDRYYHPAFSPSEPYQLV